jgi:hypothetical protein
MLFGSQCYLVANVIGYQIETSKHYYLYSCSRFDFVSRLHQQDMTNLTAQQMPSRQYIKTWEQKKRGKSTLQLMNQNQVLMTMERSESLTTQPES